MAHRSQGIAGLIVATALIAVACNSSPTAAPSSAAGGGAGSSQAPGGGTGAGASLPDLSGLGGLGALAGSVDISTLVTADMAASVIGTGAALVPGTSTPITASYATPAGDTLTIFVESLPGVVQQAILNSALSQANANGQLQPVSGIGDIAGKEVSDNSATVGFAKGGTLVIIEANSTTAAGTDLEPKVEALAQQVAGSLP